MNDTGGAITGLLCCVVVFLIVAVLPFVSFAVGYSRRKRILAELEVREAAVRGLLTTTTAELGPAQSTALVIGNTAYAADAPSTFAASWRKLIGGPMESLRLQTEIARRLATVRALEQAQRLGAKAVINLRYGSAEIGSMQGYGSQRSGKAIIEVIAYGTAWIPKQQAPGAAQSAAAARQPGVPPQSGVPAQAGASARQTGAPAQAGASAQQVEAAGHQAGTALPQPPGVAPQPIIPSQPPVAAPSVAAPPSQPESPPSPSSGSTPAPPQ